MRDLFHSLKVVPVIAPADNADLDMTPLVGNIVDHAGYESVLYVIQAGTLSDTNATYAVTLEHSDASNMANAEAVPDADLIGTEAAAGFTADDDDGAVRKLGYRGHKRYTRLTITPTGADSGDSPISAVAILGHAHDRPVA